MGCARSRARGRMGVSVYTRLRALSRYAPAGQGLIQPRRSNAEGTPGRGAVPPQGGVNR